MKKGKFVFMACFVWLSLIFSANSSHAMSISNSMAIIHWDTLDISGIEIEWISKGSGSWAEAWDDWDYDWSEEYKDGWVYTSALASVTNATADAWTDDMELHEEVFAMSTGPYEAYSYAGAVRWGVFKALETGDLTISVDYYLTQELSTEYLGESAEGEAYALLALYSGLDGVGVEDQRELWNSVYNGGSGYWEDSGTLTVTLWFDEGQVGEFYADVWNHADVYSPVPVPCTMLLLGSGLAGLGLIGRRFRKMV